MRAVVWVQGCPFRCPGCVSEEWIPDRPANLMHPAELVQHLLDDPSVEGLTFSGGEPMAQAAALAETYRLASANRSLTLICYTGYRLEQLRERPPNPGVGELLELADVLIDGLYSRTADDGRGLRGSTNQQVHHLTGRLAAFADEFVTTSRRAEIIVRDERMHLVGLPPPGLIDALQQLWEPDDHGRDESRTR
ncbi:4Fe-4S single cluster domain-containing protein [Catellatospora citrea]|uniref:4Fe-4S single cluster domain-containing protein n=1 Tax=Catellatospora citrea TaxID=53366 RepID=UPI0033C05DF3